MSASDNTRVRKFFERGLFFFAKEQYPDACVNFKDALQIYPNFLPARTHLALSLAHLHKYVDAIKVLEEGRKLVPLRPYQQVEVLLLLGNICLIRQDYPAATYYLNAALKIDPNCQKLKQMLATCYCKSGEFSKGLDLLMACAQQ